MCECIYERNTSGIPLKKKRIIKRIIKLHRINLYGRERSGTSIAIKLHSISRMASFTAREMCIYGLL